MAHPLTDTANTHAEVDAFVKEKLRREPEWQIRHWAYQYLYGAYATKELVTQEKTSNLQEA